MPLRAFTLVALLALAPAAVAQQGGRATRDAGPKLAHFALATGAVTSAAVRDGDAGYTILLPKGADAAPDEAPPCPWVLWLPGFGGTDEFLTRGGAAVLDRLRGEDRIPAFAVVVYHAPGRRARSIYMNGEAAADTENLLVGDFLTQVQKKHRLADDRARRAVMGISAGGFGALKLALRHPDVFGAVAAHSAAILPADPKALTGMTEQVVHRFLRAGLAKEVGQPIDAAKWQAHMPLALAAARTPADLRGLQIYFDAGTADHYGFCPANEELSAVLSAHGHKHVFRKVDGGGHAFASAAMPDNIAHALRFLGAALLGKDARAEFAGSASKSSQAAPEDAAATPGRGK